MEKINVLMVMLLFCTTVFAQNTDTTAVTKTDTIASKKTTELPEVGITAPPMVTNLTLQEVFQQRVGIIRWC